MGKLLNLQPIDWKKELKQDAQAVLGLLLMLGVQAGLKEVIPEGMGFLWLRYAFVGITATGVWPVFFTRCRL